MANVNLRIDDELKKQADAVFSDLGLNFSTATVMFLKQVVRHNGIPFELRADPFYSAENQAVLLASKKQMETAGGAVHELIEVDND